MSGRIRVAPKAERTMHGITFASKAGMQRYATLIMMERTGMIEKLERQPRFELIAGIMYVADFAYTEAITRKQIVEDVKGMRTEVYRLKIKIFRDLYPEINFVEVKA